MATLDGGWIVIQKNKRGSTADFNTKIWVDYEEGFGDMQTEFWYGLKS